MSARPDTVTTDGGGSVMVTSEAEKNVIGALLLNPDDVADAVFAEVSADNFERRDLRLMFTTISEMLTAGQPVDVITVLARLEATGQQSDAGGLAALGELARNTHSAANARAYAEIVRDGSEQRRAQQIGRRLQAGELDTGTALHELERLKGRRSLLVQFESATALAGVEIQPVRWAWAGILPSGTASGLGGPPGATKSTLCQQLCTHIALGRPLLGRHVAHGRGVYVTVEDSPEELHRRQHAINRAIGADFGDLGRLHLRSLIGEAPILVTARDGACERTEYFGRFLGGLRALGDVSIIVLDLAVDFWTGNEINRQAVNGYVKHHLAHIARELDAAVLALYHPSKAGRADGTGESGSTGWEGSFRARLYLDPGDDTDKAAGIRTLKLMKANYSTTTEMRVQWRDGYLHPLEDGKDPAQQDQRAEGAFLELMEAAARAGQRVTTNRRGAYAPRELAKKQKALRRTTKHSTAELEQAMERLLERGWIRQAYNSHAKANGLEVVPIEERETC